VTAARLPDAFVGVFAFDFTPELRAWWEVRLEEQIPDAHARSDALAEVEAEARGAEIELTGDGEIVSRSGGTEFYRARLDVETDGLSFAKPPGVRVRLSQPEPGAILAHEPGKPAMRFVRAR